MENKLLTYILQMQKQSSTQSVPKLPKAQKGKTMFSLKDYASNINTLSNDNIPRQPAFVKEFEQREAFNKQQKEKQLKELQEREFNNRSYISQDRSTPASRAADKQRFLEAKRQEAMANSPLAQTFGSFTPSGNNPAAGSIAASQFVKTMPLIAGTAAGATALPSIMAGLNAPIAGVAGLTGNNIMNAGFAYEAAKNLPNVGRSIKTAYQKPTLSNVGNAAAQTALTTLDALPFGASLAPGVKAAIKASKESGLLSNAYNLNPYAFKSDPTKYYRQAGKSAYDDAIIEGKMYSKGQKDLLERNPDINYVNEYNASIAADQAGKFNLAKPANAPFVQKGNLFYPINRKPTGTGYKGTKFADAEYLFEGALPDQAVLPRYQEKYLSSLNQSGGAGVVRPEYNDLNNFKTYQRDWLQGYKEVPKPTSTQQVTRGPVNYWEEPGFAKRNPNFNPEAYANSPVGNTSASKDIPEGMTPKLNWDTDINWAKWNPEIPKNEKLMEEYINIENSTKANNTWMKNPDGSEFKGTPEQFIQQQSQNFKKAFGNSKLVNPDGSPIMLYHGAPQKFNFFNPELFQRQDAGYSGVGIYTTPSKTTADSYAYSSRSSIGGKEHVPTVYELYGQANNPISAEELINEGGKRDLFNFNRQANWKGEIPVEERLTGYDAAIANTHPNVTNVRPWNDAYEIVFPKNTQLKSAIGNNGMFDMNNPNIYKALIPAVGAAGVLGAQQKAEGGPIVDSRGQWAHPGKVTRIPGSNKNNKTNITMKDVNYPVLGIGSNGGSMMMYPEQEYEFNGSSYVDEYPMMGKGGQMIRRADGSYSKRGLWDNIRANKGSGKKPTKEMLEQERKIKAKNMENGGTNNAGFEALPEYVQAKILSQMGYGGYYNPYMAEGGEANGSMALGQIMAVSDKMNKLRQFISPEQNLDPWIASKLAVIDDSTAAISDYMMYNPEAQGEGGEEEMGEENEQEGQEEMMANGGYVVTRSNDRKGKTHKVTGPGGVVKYFGDSKLGQHPKDPKRKAAFYARHKKNLDGNPFFRAFARKTWEDGGSTFSGNAWYQDGGDYDDTNTMNSSGAYGYGYEMGGYIPDYQMAYGGAPQNYYGNQAKNFTFASGGRVGQEMEVTPQEAEMLRQQGYQFEIL